MQAHLLKEVVQQDRAAARDHALALVPVFNPIADTTVAVAPIDRVAAHRAGERSIVPNARLRSLVVPELGADAGYEMPNVVSRIGIVHPRQPLPGVVAVVSHQCV